MTWDDLKQVSDAIQETRREERIASMVGDIKGVNHAIEMRGHLEGIHRQILGNLPQDEIDRGMRIAR